MTESSIHEAEWAMSDAEEQAWDDLWDTDAARSCSCPSCNFYAPDYEQHKGEPCVLRTIIERIVAERLPKTSTRRTDWGVRDDATGNVGTVGAYNRAAAEKWLAELTNPSTLMKRERTTYEDNVTEWVPLYSPGPRADQ